MQWLYAVGGPGWGWLKGGDRAQVGHVHALNQELNALDNSEKVSLVEGSGHVVQNVLLSTLVVT